MDPLSITVSVVGLLRATAGAVQTLQQIWISFSDAPKTVQNILAEVTGISACLGQLQSFFVNLETIHRSRAALLMVDQVVVSLTECVSVFSELQQLLGKIKKKAIKAQPMLESISARLKVVSHEQESKDILVRLQSSKSTLNLMLATITCSSAEEAKSSVQSLTQLVQEVLDSNREIARRLQSLVYQASIRAQAAGCDISIIQSQVDSDDASIVRLPGDMTASIQQACSKPATVHDWVSLLKRISPNPEYILESKDVERLPLFCPKTCTLWDCRSYLA
ncbi:MAG: hypothetical protein MMC33_006351 [Icmadophila ericetorum]|nr:hypothetical protein [Icmadophila ericetorum]